MNKGLMFIGIIWLVVGFIIFAIGFVGCIGAKNEYNEASSEYYNEVYSSNPERDDVKRLADDMVEGTSNINSWENVIVGAGMFEFLGFIFCFLALLMRSKRDYTIQQFPPRSQPPYQY